MKIEHQKNNGVKWLQFDSMQTNLVYYNIFSKKVKHFHGISCIPQLFTRNLQKYYVN